MTGGSDKNYIKFLVNAAQKEGYRCVVYHNRGVNKTKLLTPEPYDGAKLDDVEEAVTYVRNKYPEAPIFAVGMSFGGNQLLRYLAKKGEDSPFVASVTLAAPFNLTACLNDLAGSIYEKYLIRGMVKNVV